MHATHRLPKDVEQRESQFFGVKVLGPTLVISFQRPCQVVSWAPLHGGFRTDVSHVLSYQVQNSEELDSPQATLRRAASKAGIRGTFVGIMTGSNLHQCSLARAGCSDLCIGVISILDAQVFRCVGKERLPGAPGRNRMGLIVTINQWLTHEAMLEAISVATEARVRELSEFEIDDLGPEKKLTAGVSSFYVVIAAGGARRHDTCDRSSILGGLMWSALTESLRQSLKKDLSRLSKQG